MSDVLKTDRLLEHFSDALCYAHEVHRGQCREKTHAPYISHVLGVASLALEHGADDSEAVAALLHDSVEDAGGQERLEDIRRRFGERAAELVEGLSDWVEGADGERGQKLAWRECKERYLSRMEQADSSVLLISACDKLHNARALARDYYRMGETTFDRFTEGGEATRWYYRRILEVMEERAPEALVTELRHALRVFLEPPAADGYH